MDQKEENPVVFCRIVDQYELCSSIRYFWSLSDMCWGRPVSTSKSESFFQAPFYWHSCTLTQGLALILIWHCPAVCAWWLQFVHLFWSLPATEINMFGHVSQMRKPKFCELVWTPAVSQPMWGEWKLDFATKKQGKQLLSPGGPHSLPGFLLSSLSAQPSPLFLLCVTSLCRKFNSFHR